MAIKVLLPKQERIINFVTEFLGDKGYSSLARMEMQNDKRQFRNKCDLVEF
jgi:hypothetical protein